MPEKVEEVRFSLDDLNTVHVILQGEVLRLGDIRKWFTDHEVDFPSEKEYARQIDGIVSICNRLTAMILEGVPDHGKKYVLRPVSK